MDEERDVFESTDSIVEEMDRLEAEAAKWRAIAQSKNPASAYIWVTGGIAYYETSPGVEVTFVDWDNYRDGNALDYTLDDLREKLEELQLMPDPTSELQSIKAEAIASMQDIVNERELEDAERAKAEQFEKGYQGYVKYAAGEVISLQCHEQKHGNCPDRLDGYDCECPCHSEEVSNG